MLAKTKPIKPKKCKAKSCGKKFTPRNSLQQGCSPGCAQEIAKEKIAKRYKSETWKMRREFNMKDRSLQDRKAQEACNAYIRERDRFEPCISCDTEDQSLTYDAGHYLTRGAYPELRFHEDNIHKQCSFNCNKNRGGNPIEYRKRLLIKIGEKRLAFLEGPHQIQNYTIDDFVEIRKHFKAKTKQLIQDRKDNEKQI